MCRTALVSIARKSGINAYSNDTMGWMRVVMELGCLLRSMVVHVFSKSEKNTLAHSGLAKRAHRATPGRAPWRFDRWNYYDTFSFIWLARQPAIVLSE